MLDEESIGQPYYLYKMRASLCTRHSGAPSRGAVSQQAWRVDARRQAVTHLCEQLRCGFSPRLCALGLVRLEDVYGGPEPRGEGHLMSYDEMRATLKDGRLQSGEVSTDHREYTRLLFELDHLPRAMQWRRDRVSRQASITDEISQARSRLRARKALLLVEVRHARRTDGLGGSEEPEYHVPWAADAEMPDDEWLHEAELEVTIGRREVNVQIRAAAEDYAARAPLIAS